MSYTSLIATAVMEHCARRGVHLDGADFDRFVSLGRAMDAGALDEEGLRRIASLPHAAMLQACDRVDATGVVAAVDEWLSRGGDL